MPTDSTVLSPSIRPTCTPAQPFPSQRILVAVDCSKQSLWAAKAAATFAQQFDCDLGLVHVFNFSVGRTTFPAGLDGPDAAGVLRAREDFLADFPVSPANGRKVDRFLREGDAVEQIVNTAVSWNADLIVVGTHATRGLRRLFLGNVAAGVVRHARCPVLCVGEEPTGPLGQTILVPIDRSDQAKEALDWATQLVGRTSGQLLLLHVVPFPAPLEPGFEFVAADVASALREEGEAFLETLHPHTPANAPVIRLVRQGQPVHEIIEAATEWKADLIAMGAFGERGVARVVLGSVADHVLRRAACPVVCLGRCVREEGPPNA
jgi:nucleotide-binding universal stress UspA family protein